MRVLVRAERGEVESVSKYCRSLIDRDHPATPLIWEGLAKGYLREYQPHRADKVLQEWLQREPDNPQALLHPGASLRSARTLSRCHRLLSPRHGGPTLDEARLRACARPDAAGVGRGGPCRTWSILAGAIRTIRWCK